MKKKIRALALRFEDESGQDLIEYALIAMMIGLAAVGAFSGLGGIILAKFSTIADAF